MRSSGARSSAGILPAAWAAAAELQVVSLADALALCLLVRDREPARFGRVALRWHSRFCAETSNVQFEDARVVLDLLSGLTAGEPRPAARALRELLASYDGRLADAVRQWEAELAVARGR